MAKILPVFDLPDFIYTIALGPSTYRIRFNWDSRESRWYFSLYAADEAPIITGVKVLHGSSLLYNLSFDGFSHGVIYLDSPSGNYLPPDRDTLLTDFRVMYITVDELNELIST